MEDLAEIAALVGRHHADPADSRRHQRPALDSDGEQGRLSSIAHSRKDVLDIQDLAEVVEALPDRTPMCSSHRAFTADVII